MRFLLAICLALATFAASAEDWVLDSKKNGIAVYSRFVPGQQIKDFRAVMRVKNSLLDVVSALADVERMPDWFYQMKETRILQADSLDNIYIYMVIAGMGPVQDRDVTIKAEIWQDPISLEMLMEGFSVQKMDDMPGRIRMPEMRAGWRVRPITPDITEIELTGAADPGGAIPLWAANMVVTVLPRESLDKLRSKLKKSAYLEELRQRRETDPRWRLFKDFRFSQR